MEKREIKKLNFQEIIPAADLLSDELDNIKGGRTGITICDTGYKPDGTICMVGSFTSNSAD